MLSQHESSSWPECDRVTQSSSHLWIHVGKFHTIGEICAESVVLTTYGRNKSVCFWQNRPEKSQILAISIYAKSSPGRSQLFTGTAQPSFAIAARPSPQHEAIFGDGDVPSSPSFCHGFCQSCWAHIKQHLQVGNNPEIRDALSWRLNRWSNSDQLLPSSYPYKTTRQKHLPPLAVGYVWQYHFDF